MPPMRILKISAQDEGGGAAGVARDLARMFRARGHACVTAVGARRGRDDHVLEIPDKGAGMGWACAALGTRDAISPWLGKVRGAGRIHDLLHCFGRPQRLLDRLRGTEDFTLPSSAAALDMAPWPPDLVHAHNLHSFRGPLGHFDLRVLPALTAKVPWVLTLHDAWLTTGHCAHSLACERWLTGCGRCPDLGLFPAVHRDGTAANWQRKRDIFAKSRFYVASPSRWLMDRVERSMLAPATIEGRVIANGVDLSIFHPGNREQARQALDLPRDCHVLVFVVQGLTGRSWKDFATVRQAVFQLAHANADRSILLLVLGEDSAPERLGPAEIRYLPFRKDAGAVAEYYRASDIYVHAAHADTFPSAVIEAMACGTPVIATSVGGIPEQVTPETGVLVPAKDGDAMARAIVTLLDDPGRRRKLSDNAAVRARECFDLQKQADAYLAWFQDILESRGRTS